MDISKLIVTRDPFIQYEKGQVDDHIIRFKYYGEFNMIKKIHTDCKDDLVYIGNSNIDGAPIFNYHFDKINMDILEDSKKLNLHIRKLKIRKYQKKELKEKDISLLTFIEFLMYSLSEMLIKQVPSREIDYYSQ